MISRRNFFSMILMMAALLFLFQVPEIVKEKQSDYDVNTHFQQNRLSGALAWEQGNGAWEDGDFVVYFGSKESSLTRVVRQWCSYTKRNLRILSGPEAYTPKENCLPEAILIDSHTVDLSRQLQALQSYTEYGITLVFCNLPGAAEIQDNRELMKLLGIAKVRQTRVEAEGVRLFGGFLLGGESSYIAKSGDEEEQKRQDLNLSVPWYITASGTKTYMVATLDELLKDEEAKNEVFPSLIWRNVQGDSRIFVVNGSYLEDMTGVGILDGILYEASDYALYPVVNAQNFTVLNYPQLAGENDEKLETVYSRNSRSVQRDVFWPTISSLLERTRSKLTCLMSVQFVYTDNNWPNRDEIPFYLQQFKEFTAEAGISLARISDTVLLNKVISDGAFFDSLGSSYAYSAFYVPEEDIHTLRVLLDYPLFDNIRTLAGEYREDEPVVSYYSDDVTKQNATAELADYTYSDDLRVRSLETALGYSNALLDLYPVIWPESGEDQWEKVADKVASNLDTWWKPFAAFEKTTLSESDARVRSFLNLDYSTRREGDVVTLSASGDSGWFLFRTHGEKIRELQGGTFKTVEKDAYLIRTRNTQVRITLEPDRETPEFSLE